jgi:hypothetical protein
MGDTIRYAERIGLLEMQPRGDLTSTRLALVNPGVEYLALQPEPGGFTVTAGTYSVEWFGVNGRRTLARDDVTIGGADPASFDPPFHGEPTVLYLRSAQ